MTRARRLSLLGLTTIAGLCLVYLRRRGSLTSPVVGTGDTEHLEWIPFFFGKILHFSPWPKLTLFQNWVLYPTGGTATYLPFSWESNYLIHGLNSAVGHGPWSLLYFLGATAALFLSTYWLLSSLYPARLAGGISFLVAFGNGYVQAKFPRHANMAYCHWTVLTLVFLFVFLSWLDRRNLTWVRRLGLLSPLLICGSLGQDPGYLIPWCVTLWFLALVLILCQRVSRETFLDALNVSELRNDPEIVRRLLPIGGLSLLFLFLYLPLNAQVAYDSLLNPPVEQGGKWANPLRWLLPAFPYLFDTAWDAYKNIFADIGDAEMAGVPGWHLMLSALLGLSVLSLKRALSSRFLALVLALLVCHHPVWFPVLKIFPWHLMSRSSVRYAVLLAPLLALLSLGFWSDWRKFSKPVVGLIAFLFLLEPAAQIWGLGGTVRGLSAEEQLYFSAIAQAPGEALMEWPFCLTAWNQPPEGLCAAREKHYFTYNTQRFHHKKTLSVDLGRASRRERAEWNSLPFVPLFESIVAKRCFNAAEWRFFLAQYRLYDFAGVEIYPELLPEGCLAEWEKRFGKAKGRLKSPGTPERVFFKRPSRS